MRKDHDALIFKVMNLIMLWMPALTGFLIRWSISGFLQRRTAQTNIIPVKEMSLKTRFAVYTKKFQSGKSSATVTSW
ncbi:hypothetical protein Y032_0002g592 [Ancylostoma ceylanicum]|nr:hypothetical protein Y032_0002g592 [Ancylostoma ceylanicum]